MVDLAQQDPFDDQAADEEVSKRKRQFHRGQKDSRPGKHKKKQRQDINPELAFLVSPQGVKAAQQRQPQQHENYRVSQIFHTPTSNHRHKGYGLFLYIGYSVCQIKAKGLRYNEDREFVDFSGNGIYYGTFPKAIFGETSYNGNTMNRRI